MYNTQVLKYNNHFSFFLSIEGARQRERERGKCYVWSHTHTQTHTTRIILENRKILYTKIFVRIRKQQTHTKHNTT